ncbi:unnamed protein product [Staurois parvus]|uniref:Uncharacterized protein n=1 Tax=Staurois parvus TaxID=386267 RepID=A0ABN9B4Z0_9NEOB|nr:unnamed protein product [Staurois parvus]
MQGAWGTYIVHAWVSLGKQMSELCRVQGTLILESYRVTGRRRICKCIHIGGTHYSEPEGFIRILNGLRIHEVWMHTAFM